MRIRLKLASSTVLVLGASAALAQDNGVNYSFFGTPGLLEMPSAQSAPVNEFALSGGYTEGAFRATLSFQVTPRLSGSFRYAVNEFYDADPSADTLSAFERGIDLQYRFNNEGTYLPAIAVGLRDLLDPGRYGAEYIVASRSVGDDVIVTAGVGWGQLGTRDGFGSSDRPVFDEANPDGAPATDAWFRGQAAIFGGLEYQLNDTWGLKAEYSSSDYGSVPFGPAVEVDQPYNFGVIYRPRPDLQVGLSYLYGNQLALSGTAILNPGNRPGLSGIELAPLPVKPRIGDAFAAATWDRAAVPEPALRRTLAELLRADGIALTGLTVTDRTASVQYRNGRYRAEAQAQGRIARIMTQIMPPSVALFVLRPERQGVPVSAVTIRRSDLEVLENMSGASAALLARTQFDDALRTPPAQRVITGQSAFSWGVAPYFVLNAFSPTRSGRFDLGAGLNASYKILPNLIIAGTIGQSIRPAQDTPRMEDGTPDIQNVRTDGFRYGRDGVPTLQKLSAAHFGRPAPDLYSRVSVGYLERIFGGVSTELLWKPVQSRFGLGAELNYVVQRDADMRFGFDEYDYDVVTGHLSAYYDLGNGYHTQLDVGRYLAEDWGATMTVDREFNNGWRVGAYFSRTDMSSENFGDGSYNKGIRITVPQDFLTGSPNTASYDATLRTPSRDGGARLQVDGRLYDVVRDGHQADLEDTWGRFWR